MPAPPPIFEPAAMMAPQSTPNGGFIESLSPAEAHDVGSTIVTVNGRGFKGPQDLRCNFGASSVVADYISSTQVTAICCFGKPRQPLFFVFGRVRIVDHASAVSDQVHGPQREAPSQ